VLRLSEYISKIGDFAPKFKAEGDAPNQPFFFSVN